MPGISIDVNDRRIATIDLTGLQTVDVSVRGALDCEPGAALTAMGGNYEAGRCSHLFWIFEQALLHGEVVRISLDEQCGIADKGKTIKELFPDAEPSAKTDFTISDEMAAEIRARPRLRESFIVQGGTSSGQAAQAASDDRNTDFVFGLLWSSFQPDQVRVRLSTYCFDDVLARTGGTQHLKTMIDLGESASFSLVQ